MISRIIKNNLKRLYFSLKYSVVIKSSANVSSGSVFEGQSVIYQGCNILDSFIGLGTYVAPYSRLQRTKVGRFCSIGQNIQTFIGRHPVNKFVSTHPAFFSLQEQSGFTFVQTEQFDEHLYIDEEKKFVVEIGNDVWIGNNVMIMDGVKIGDGAIIGAGSIVTKDIAPYSVNVGIPAKKTRDRFDEKYINFLLNFKWWNKSFKWL